MPKIHYIVAHCVGEEVNIKAIDQRATVTQICIAGHGGASRHVTFECVWFANGARQTAWLHGFEIVDCDPQPLQKSPGFAG